jgi:WD40 repeat protein
VLLRVLPAVPRAASLSPAKHFRSSSALRSTHRFRFLQHWGGITAVALCTTAHDVYTGSSDCSIKRWTDSEVKRSSSKSSCSKQHQVPALYANQSAQASGSSGKSFVNSHDLMGHTGWASSLAATESLLTSASYDTTIRLWSAKNCKQVGVLADTHTAYVPRLAVAQSAARLVSAPLRCEGATAHLGSPNTADSLPSWWDCTVE